MSNCKKKHKTVGSAKKMSQDMFRSDDQCEILNAQEKEKHIKKTPCIISMLQGRLCRDLQTSGRWSFIFSVDHAPTNRPFLQAIRSSIVTI